MILLIASNKITCEGCALCPTTREPDDITSVHHKARLRVRAYVKDHEDLIVMCHPTALVVPLSHVDKITGNELLVVIAFHDWIISRETNNYKGQ